MKLIRLANNDVCSVCGEAIAAGELAYEDETDETTTICESCYDYEQASERGYADDDKG